MKFIFIAINIICPIACCKLSAYSFEKSVSSPIGEYFLSITPPSLSVNISSGSPSLILKVHNAMCLCGHGFDSCLLTGHDADRPRPSFQQATTPHSTRPLGPSKEKAMPYTATRRVAPAGEVGRRTPCRRLMRRRNLSITRLIGPAQPVVRATGTPQR